MRGKSSIVTGCVVMLFAAALLAKHATAIGGPECSHACKVADMDAKGCCPAPKSKTKTPAPARPPSSRTEKKTPKGGTIEIYARSDSNVFGAYIELDGAPQGQAPLTLTASAAKHLVRLSKAGFGYETWVTVEEGQRVTLVPPELKPLTGIVRVFSDTTGGNAFIDGSDMGPVPVDIKDIRAGEHIFEVRAPGMTAPEQRISVAGGESKVLRFELKPLSKCASIHGLEHTIVEIARSRTAVPISVLVGADVAAQRISLMYRTEGMTDFAEVKLKKEADCKYKGSIPASAVRGSIVHYYVAALNDAGKAVASKGSAGSPNLIEVVE